MTLYVGDYTANADAALKQFLFGKNDCENSIIYDHVPSKMANCGIVFMYDYVTSDKFQLSQQMIDLSEQLQISPINTLPIIKKSMNYSIVNIIKSIISFYNNYTF